VLAKLKHAHTRCTPTRHAWHIVQALIALPRYPPALFHVCCKFAHTWHRDKHTKYKLHNATSRHLCRTSPQIP
jgi:hypothetical protein